MTDGQPGPRTGRVRFTATTDIERLLADAPGIRAALLEEGVPATALSVTADAQLAVLHASGRWYVRFATAGNGDPVAVELPSGRVVELVTRRHPPPETIVNVALYSTSVARFCKVWEAFHAREPFYSQAEYESLEASGQIERLRTALLADLERIDPGAATGIWADLAWDIDMGDYPSEETRQETGSIASACQIRADLLHSGSASLQRHWHGRAPRWSVRVDAWPHRFRHHFSHTWLDRGGAEEDLMELNGWSSPQMLRRYGASARSARARRTYDRIMTGQP